MNLHRCVKVACTFCNFSGFLWIEQYMAARNAHVTSLSVSYHECNGGNWRLRQLVLLLLGAISFLVSREVHGYGAGT